MSLSLVMALSGLRMIPGVLGGVVGVLFSFLLQNKKNNPAELGIELD